MHYNSYGWERGKRSSESLDTNHNSHNVIKSLCFPVFHIGYLVSTEDGKWQTASKKGCLDVEIPAKGRCRNLTFL